MVVFAILKVMSLATLMTLCRGKGQDATVVPGSFGAQIVNIVISRIRSNCIFSEDRLFLRRTAHVMSRDGYNSGTYRTGFDGGIWQVTESMFRATKNCAQTYIMSACNNMSSSLGIHWPSVTWSDLRKPLHSGVAAALFALLTLRGNEMPGDIPSQADVWSKMYSLPNATFVSEATQTPVFKCKKKMDLAFILDSSASVSDSDFDLMKNFAAEVVDVMNVSSDGVRVADIVYSTSVRVFFDFNNISTKEDVKTKLLNTTKLNSGTDTASALDQAKVTLYDYSGSGAREDVTKVAVLVTDGMSNSFSRTNSSAHLLKDNTTVFAVGVGNYRLDELKAIASDPICSHVMTLTSFDKIASIITEIQKSTCEANYKPTNTTINMTSEGKLTVESRAPDPSKTIEAKVVCGILNIYVSTTDPKPGPAVFDDRYLATPKTPAVLRIVETLAPGTPVYVTVVGTRLPASAASLKNCSDYSWSLGPTENKDVQVTCEENGVSRSCTKNDIMDAGLCPEDDLNYPVDNPCTKENLDNGILRHSYPYNPTKFLQCDLKGNVYITLCPGRVNFNTQSRECGFNLPGGPDNQGHKPVYSVASGDTSPCTTEAVARNQFYHAYGPDDTKFIQCDVWGNAFLMDCPPKTVWSQSAYTCIHDTTATSPSANVHSVSCTDEDLQPDPCNHKRYYQCVNGDLILQHCPGSLHFNATAGYCDWAPGNPAPIPVSCR